MELAFGDHYPKHLHSIYTTSTPVQRCINVLQMFNVCWVAPPGSGPALQRHLVVGWAARHSSQHLTWTTDAQEARASHGGRYCPPQTHSSPTHRLTDSQLTDCLLDHYQAAGLILNLGDDRFLLDLSLDNFLILNCIGCNLSC